MRHFRSVAALAALVLWTIGCGSDPPTQPTPPTLKVTSIQPASGSSFGGTNVTIAGENFAAGATVTIGGITAANVVVVNDRSITATTAARAAGPGDVVVSVAGRQATLGGGFTFVAPAIGPNTPPEVAPLTAQGSRAGQPAAMADLGEAITVRTTVSDAESALESLGFVWTASLGTIEGTGGTVTYRAPATLPETPATVVITLTVVEKYQEAGANGLPIEREYRVGQTITVRVHDSAREVAEMGRQFLLAFSNSAVSAETVVRDFTDACRGKQDEYQDVVDDRVEFEILSSSIGVANATSVNFGGACVIADRVRSADACAYYPVRWVSRSKINGETGYTEGTDQVTAVYRERRWWLCDSDYIQSNGGPASSFRNRRGR